MQPQAHTADGMADGTKVLPAPALAHLRDIVRSLRGTKVINEYNFLFPICRSDILAFGHFPS